jgi:hypothetical protein
LSQASCTDPAVECLSCASDHRFFITSRPNLSRASEQASRLKLTQLEGKSPEEVARFWLSDSHARAHLNDQLAEMLRVFLEGRPAAQEFRPMHCPDCGDLLEAYEQPDIWVRGQRCSKGHTWAARGTHLGGVVEGALMTFNGEPSNAVLASLAAGWLKHNPSLDPQLHHSLRPLLESLLQQRRE